MNSYKIFFYIFLFLLWPSATIAQSVIRLAIPYPLWKIDPLATEDPINRLILSNIGKSPIRYSREQSQLELIEQISAENDYKDWTIKIKSDIYFADGSPLNAETFQSAIEFYQKYFEQISRQNYS